MSGWFWRMIALKATFVAVCLVSYIRADDIVRKLPFCNPHNSNEGSANNDLVIVSTLDGRLTAFSTHNGAKAWDLETLPLLSSNLHHVELTSGGKWVRLVPSLRGTLYSMSGDTIEPLPFNAEQLLSSSFKYSDDLVIAGARETLWLGLDSSTGSVIYECGSGGCSSEQQTAGEGREVLVLRRHSNTVRALDPRTGSEKWNFSVAEHQLALSNARECAGAASGPSAASPAIAVALPEGVVAVRHPDTLAPLWQHKLEAPVAGMWRLQDGLLQNIDVLWEATKSLSDATVESTSPSLYIGVHDRQLYIQEGQLYAQKLETSVSVKPMPWKLKQSRPLLAAGHSALAPAHDPDKNTLSLITLYGTTGQTDNHGFFLYLQETCDQVVTVKEDTFGGADILKPNDSNDESQPHHIHVHIYSLWYWWKEVFVIAISSALLMNLMIWPRFFASRSPPPSPLPINQEYIVVERHYDRPPSNNATEYSGRYEKDFTPLRCLGRGGFGVVFEARNNIDHCSYAVKRITLPRRESKRERVLREVRALAKLEHEHIVRYFNAWLEEPPPYWQEQRDAVWMRELDGVSLDMSEEYDSTSMHPTKPALKNSSVKLNMLKCDDCADELSERSKRQRSYSCHDSFSVVFDDNAPSNPHLTVSSSSNTITKDSMSTGNVPNMLSREPASGDNDDSFIVFANTGEMSQGLSEARKECSVDKRLEVVKQSENYTKTENSIHSKKKKGHRRHWSLDLCVRSTTDEPAGGVCKMYLYIQMQLCLRDNLHHWLRQNRSCHARSEKVRTLFSQIVSAVEYVHLAGLIHRDLKPSNIFFAPDGKVKIGDFGLVTTMGDNSQDEGTEDMNPQARHTYRVGTHLYMSPEQLEGRPYGYKVDIYSLGLILFELLQPFGTESERVACLLQVRKHIYPHSFQKEYSNEMELLKLMLSEDPNRRPTASGVRARAPLYQQTDKTWHFTLPNPSAAVG